MELPNGQWFQRPEEWEPVPEALKSEVRFLGSQTIEGIEWLCYADKKSFLEFGVRRPNDIAKILGRLRREHRKHEAWRYQ